jgi:hypothetical protein
MRAVMTLVPVLALTVCGAPLAERSFEDRPDDDPAGHQIHFMYVVPRDGHDVARDRDGTIERSVSLIQSWLAKVTQGEPVALGVDLLNGRPDVTFARLSRSDAEVFAHGERMRATIEAELRAMGFDDQRKVYAVFYEGQGRQCGAGPWPPETPGTYGVVFLRGQPPRGNPCDMLLQASREGPRYADFAILHEVLHALGAVGRCAPNHWRAGHVADSYADLMYSGPSSWSPAALDVGRDDYFGHGRSDCPDLARSAFMRPVSASPELPPGWPYAVAPTRPCSEEHSLGSVSRPIGKVEFTNLTSHPVRVYRLDAEGDRARLFTLSPFGTLPEAAEAADAWTVTDDQDRCLVVFTALSGWSRASIRAP